MRRSDYRNHNSDFGWEIDRIVPTTQGGTDSVTNLRPLQWQNFRARRKDRLVCVVKAVRDKNVMNQNLICFIEKHNGEMIAPPLALMCK